MFASAVENQVISASNGGFSGTQINTELAGALQQVSQNPKLIAADAQTVALGIVSLQPQGQIALGGMSHADFNSLQAPSAGGPGKGRGEHER